MQAQVAMKGGVEDFEHGERPISLYVFQGVAIHRIGNQSMSQCENGVLHETHDGGTIPAKLALDTKGQLGHSIIEEDLVKRV